MQEIERKKKLKKEMKENTENLSLKIKEMDEREKKRRRILIKRTQINEINTKLKEISCNLECPISYLLINDLVVTPFGITYERKELLNWLSKNEVDPLTKKN